MMTSACGWVQARKFGGLADALWSANHPWLFLTPSGGFYRTHKYEWSCCQRSPSLSFG